MAMWKESVEPIVLNLDRIRQNHWNVEKGEVSRAVHYAILNAMIVV